MTDVYVLTLTVEGEGDASTSVQGAYLTLDAAQQAGDALSIEAAREAGWDEADGAPDPLTWHAHPRDASAPRAWIGTPDEDGMEVWEVTLTPLLATTPEPFTLYAEDEGRETRVEGAPPFATPEAAEAWVLAHDDVWLASHEGSYPVVRRPVTGGVEAYVYVDLGTGERWDPLCRVCGVGSVTGGGEGTCFGCYARAHP